MYLKRDSDGQIGEFNCPQQGWSTPTQEEIDAYLLENAKTDKTAELKEVLDAFSDAGFLYSGNTFDLSQDGALNLGIKKRLSGSAPNKFKFFDISHVKIDFTDQAGFDAFTEALSDERDRIMVKYNDYRKQIDDCTTVAQVDAIVIDFAA
jgi:hypothetical protein